MALSLVAGVDALEPSFCTAGTLSVLPSPGRRLTRLVPPCVIVAELDKTSESSRPRFGDALMPRSRS
jgi:hypothetical protein